MKKVFCELAKALPGGHETMANLLGYTKSGLQNRIYGVKGQSVSIDDALLMQKFTNRTDFAEAVARESGGVFVRIPDDVFCMEHAEEEISLQFMRVMANSGELAHEWLAAVEDGQVTAAEMKILRHFYQKNVAALAAIIELTERFYGKHEKA